MVICPLDVLMCSQLAGSDSFEYLWIRDQRQVQVPSVPLPASILGTASWTIAQGHFCPPRVLRGFMHLSVLLAEGQAIAVAHVPVVGGLRFWRTPEGYDFSLHPLHFAGGWVL